MKRLSIFILTLLGSVSLYAQPHMSATMQNIHLWRGGLVADGFVVTTDVHYSDSLDRFKIGLWGGANSVGEYKEFNYYLSYKLKGVSLTLVDTYNFSSFATYNNQEFFNYRPSETGRFLDASLRYRFEGNFPIQLSWSTVLFGRDRDAENSANRYSTFCHVEYPFYKIDSWQFDVGIGAAFALNNIDNSANFFGEKAGVVEVTLKVSNALTIKDYKIPVYMLAMWNPQSDKAYLQLCAQVLTF